MKKKFFATFFALVLVFVFCSCVPKAYADEDVKPNETVETTEENTETTTEETNQENEVIEEAEEKATFKEMLKDFLNKFLPSIISSVTSAPTLLFVYLFFRKSIKNMCEKVINSSVLSKEEKDKAIKTLTDVNDVLTKKIDELQDKVDNFDEIANKVDEKFNKFDEKHNELLNAFKVNQEQLVKMYSILAILVSENAELCNKGYAKQLLELMEIKTEEKEGE